MSGINLDQNLIAEISSRLALRPPNSDAVRDVAATTSQHFDVDGNDGTFECIVDFATGMGKTYIMAGLIEYFAGVENPARNFLLVTPGRTIRAKSIRNFSLGNAKSLREGMRADLVLVTSDNFESPAVKTAMDDPAKTKLFIFTVQSLTSSKNDEGRKTHAYQEALGASLYSWLADRNDLVILADEQHLYRSPAFSRTIADLKPEVVIGVTATPDAEDERLVVSRFPLAWAIRDGFVKKPVLVARRDALNDDRTKLLDGVTLLRYKERMLHAYCDESGLEYVNPVMLVLAGNIEEATRFQQILDSETFDGGAWIGKTLLIHSDLSGDEREKALADLDAVESPASTVRVILSVGMLKEGWDVKNVYVIASMRSSVSQVLTEQTLGRGLRLPFGELTGRQMLDTLEVLAHERYSELLDKRGVLNEQFVDYRTTIELRNVGEDGELVARPRTDVIEEEVIAVDSFLLPPNDPPSARLTDATAQPMSMPQSGAVVEAEEYFEIVREESELATMELRKFSPLRHGFMVPYTEPVASHNALSLNMVNAQSEVFKVIGRNLSLTDQSELVRTLLDGVGIQEAEDHVVASTLDVPLDVSREMLIGVIINLPGVGRRQTEVVAAGRIVDTVIEAAGTNAEQALSSYGTMVGKRLGAAVETELKQHAGGQAVTFSDEVRTVELKKVRETRLPLVDNHAAKYAKTVRRAYGGWMKSLYPYVWFDSSTEYDAAVAIDKSEAVVEWARLHRNDIPITWTQGGRVYNPDFVVFEEVAGKRDGWIVETKANGEVTSEEVAAKAKAAQTWVNTINNSGKVDAQWHYLLLTEDDVDDSKGSWSSMKHWGRSA